MSTPKITKRVPETNNAPANPTRPRALERAVLVHVRLPGAQDSEDELEELRLLAVSAGAQVCASLTGRRLRPDAATYIGKGKAEEVRDLIQQETASLVLVDHELTPAQERNLEKIIGCRVLDRTGLILDIFAQRAQSHEGKLQVELAQLAHLSTRLVRGWTHLERQKGGIGLRGPGETQLETDRRLLRDRVKHLNQRLKKVTTQRQGRRRARNKIPIPTVSLVGYTNAGKSSLFNRLTGSGVFAADQLFATLDPTMRRVHLAGNTDIILADTVGFIRHLPHKLVEAFKSTLEEVAEADLLLHVVDGANPERREQIQQVNKVLSEIHADKIPQIMVFNKIDLLSEPARRETDGETGVTKVWLSAHTGEGLDLLTQALSEHYRRHRLIRRLRLPPAAGRLHARIHDRLHVKTESHMDEGGWLMEIELTGADLAWLMAQEDFQAAQLLMDDPPSLASPGL